MTARIWRSLINMISEPFNGAAPQAAPAAY
jgi:hypothetical protein